MAISYVDYVGNGVTTNFSVTFPYLDREHVYARVNGIDVEFSWINSTTIAISPAPASTTLVRVGRDTPSLVPEVDFQDGAIVTEEQLDTNSKQNLYVSQEAEDAAAQTLGRTADGANWDGGSKRLTNLDDPVNDQDAVTKAYLLEEVGANYNALAQAAAQAAAASYDSFDDRYLGTKSSDPAFNNDGDAIAVGALYFNTTLSAWRVYTSSGWQTAPADAYTVDEADDLFVAKGSQPFNVKDYGAAGNGVANDASAIGLAIDAANAAGGGVVYFPRGIYAVNSKVTKALTSKIALVGEDKVVATILFTYPGDSGLDLSYPSQYTAPSVRNLSILTTYAGAGTALKITRASADATANALGPVVDNVEIRGYDTAADYWTNGIHLVDCWYPSLTRFVVKGKDEVVLPFSAASGVKYTRTQGLYMSMFNMQHVEDGVLQDGTTLGEGLNASVFELVGVRRGFNLSSWVSGAVGIIGIFNGHINAYERGIKTAYVVQGIYKGLLIYKTHVSSESFIGFDAVGMSNSEISVRVLGTGTGVTTGGMIGIQLVLSNNNNIHDVGLDYWEQDNSGVVVGTGSSGNTITNVTGGSLGSVIFPVVLSSDAGARNVADNITTGSGGVAVTNSSTVAQRIGKNVYPRLHQTLAANSTTPSVLGRQHDTFVTANSSSTSITQITGLEEGDVIHIMFNDVNTGVVHDPTKMLLKGGANIAVGAGGGSTLTLLWDGSRCVEVARGF